MTNMNRVAYRASGRAEIGRLVVGLIWLAGAMFNVLVTIRLSDAFRWLQDSPVPVYRWFFRDVVDVHPVFWTVLLVLGESTLGALTLARGGWAKLGLAGGALFSAFLFSLGLVYTLMMGPYALLLAWLARRDYPQSPFQRIRDLSRRNDTRSHT